jgi:hypothetical protein
MPELGIFGVGNFPEFGKYAPIFALHGHTTSVLCPPCTVTVTRLPSLSLSFSLWHPALQITARRILLIQY